MKTLTTIIAALMAFLMIGTAQAQNSILKPGDPIQVELKAPVEDTQVVSSVYTISSRGTIKLPYLAEMQAANMSTTDLARRIEAAYKAAEIYTNPTLNVNMGITPGGAGAAAHVVTVGGEVKSGGREVPLRDGMTLYQAIMAAGGFADFADPRKVKLVRKGRETVIDMKKTGALGAASTLLMDGDVIHVPTN